MLDKPSLEEARSWGRRFPDWRLNPFWLRPSDSNFRSLIKPGTPVSVIFKYGSDGFLGEELFIIDAEVLKSDGALLGVTTVRFHDRDFRISGRQIYVVRRNKLMSRNRLA